MVLIHAAKVVVFNAKWYGAVGGMADMDGRMGGEKRTARRVVKIAPRRVGTGLRAIPHLGLTRRATFAAWNRRINEAALPG